MKIDRILVKKSCWLLIGACCFVIITYSVVVGTDSITREMDALFKGNKVNGEGLYRVILPAILTAAIAAWVKGKCIGKYSVEVVKELYTHVGRQILNLKNEFWAKKSNGKLLVNITSDMNEAEQFASTTLPNFINAVISIGIMAVYVGYQNKYMLFTAVVLYPFVIAVMTRWGNILKRLAQKRRGNIDSMVEQVTDSIQGIEVIKSYNLYEVFFTKIEGSIEKILDNEYKRAWIMHFSQTVQRFLFCIPNMICPTAAFLLVLKGSITIGQMTGFIVLMNKMVSNMREMPFLIVDIKEKRVAIERLNRIMTAQVRKETETIAANGCLSMENVSFGYAEGKTVLKNMNLSLERNKTYAFAGMSGQGKSTILRLLSGLEDCNEGKCTVPENCAIVPQKPFLFHGTIAENIGIGRNGATMEEIKNAAIAAGIHDKIMSRENQYGAMVGENGAGLSGGEKQRVCIARALVSEADVLLLDEATASVDRETEEVILHTLRQLQGKKTILLVSHKLSMIKDADKIFVVNEGKIVGEGSHEELLENSSIYKKWWNMEAENEVS